MPEMTAAKAIMAGIGATATAIGSAAATASVVLADDKVDFTEYGTIATAVALLIGTIYAVWKTPNKPKTQAQETYDWRKTGL